MIQPLRRTHYWVWIFLPVLIGLVFVAALATRHWTQPANPNVRWEEFR